MLRNEDNRVNRSDDEFDSDMDSVKRIATVKLVSTIKLKDADEVVLVDEVGDNMWNSWLEGKMMSSERKSRPRLIKRDIDDDKFLSDGMGYPLPYEQYRRHISSCIRCDDDDDER